MDKTKVCEICGKTKPLNEFSKSYRNRCKACVADQTRAERHNKKPGKQIDWEQRTWEAAKELFIHSDTITADQAVKAAQDLVLVYRELSNDLKIKEQ